MWRSLEPTSSLLLRWPPDEDNTYVDFVHEGVRGKGSKRAGERTWLRLTESRTQSAKSVFLFYVQGSVAKSTHAGLPWLRFVRKQCSDHVHFWPFDGWEIPAGRSTVAEVYPSLWTRRFPNDNGRKPDQQAAYAAAAWLRRADMDCSLVRFSARRLSRASGP